MAKKFIVVALVLAAIFLAAESLTADHAVIIMGHGATLGSPKSKEFNMEITEKAPGIRDEFWNDLYLMWELFYKDYGWPEKKAGADVDGIYVLHKDGDDWREATWRYRADTQTSNPWIYKITDYPENKQDVKNIFNWLANGNGDQGVPKMGPQDLLFLYNNSHGECDLGHWWICTYDSMFIDTAFVNCVDAIQSDKKVFWMNQCFSGGFISQLAGSNSIVNTACSEYESARNCDNVSRNGSPLPENEIPNPSDTCHHQEYSFHLMNAFRKKAIYDDDFGYSRPPVVNADLNGDGRISVYEAWVYARDHDSRSEVPQWSDLGNNSQNLFLNYIPQMLQLSCIQNMMVDMGNINTYGTVVLMEYIKIHRIHICLFHERQIYM